MDSSVLLSLLSNPMVLGAVIKMVIDMVHGLLVKLDAQGALKPFEKHINGLLIVTTLLASVLTAAKAGQLGSLDLTSLGDVLATWIPAVIGGKAVSVVTLPPAKK